MKKTITYLHKKIIRIVLNMVAIMLSVAFLLILCNCSKNAKEESSSYQESVVSENSQIQTSTEQSNPENGQENSSSKENTISKNSQIQTSSQQVRTEKGPENSSSKEDVVSTESQKQTSTQQVRPEKVIQTYSFQYQENYNGTDYIQETFYDTQSGNTLPYCLFVPKNYSASKKYPVILFLHGAGEIGTDNLKQLNNLGNMFKYNSDIVSNAIILCPQTPEWWRLDRDQYNDYNGTLGSALHLLNNITQKYSCDSNRIYVMGLSMGGYATWDLLERCGNVFAAGVPICGGGNSSNGAAYKDIPIRIYHGTDDNTVPFSSSQAMYNAIVQAGGQKVDFIKLQGVGHNAWKDAFADREMFKWMFAQNKANIPNESYEHKDEFSIKDAKGKIIITHSDVVQASYRRDSNKNDKMIIELTLTSKGRSNLDKAYTSSNGSPFTFYYGTQKVYSFTATASPKDNIFCIADVFDTYSFYKFYAVIEKAISQY